MKKTFKFSIVAVLLIAVLSFVLVGCVKEVSLEGGNPEATTYNNNSNVVTQGDYIYFVNGKISLDTVTEKKHNKYGNVVKGAIYRAKKDGSDMQVLVPQLAFDANNSNGISVLGNYLYFTSPSMTSGKDGSLQKTYTDFFRVQINGQKLEKITTISSNTMQYKFTDKGLIYLHESKLTYLPYGGKAKVISERASSSYFPVTSTYAPNKEDASMNVYFTESPEKNEGDPYNVIKCVTPSGEVKDVLNGEKSKSTYSLKSVEKENQGVAVYYEKKVYDKGNTSDKGLFGITVNDKLQAGAEKQFTTRTGLTVRYIDYATGVYVFENNEMYIPNIENGMEKGKKAFYSLRTESGSISSSDIFTIRKEGEKQYLYFIASNGLCKVEMLDNALAMAVELLVENIVTDFVKPVLDGNNFYYYNSAYYNYMYKIDISKESNKSAIFGVRTSEDKEAYIKYVQGMKEDAREEHNKLIQEDLKIEESK